VRHLDLKLAYRKDDVELCKSGGFPIPRSVTIFPSEKCNLRCLYCHSRELHKGGIMSFETFKGIIDELNELNVGFVAFEGGGEPLLNKDLGKFIRYCKELGMGVGVITNGTVYIPELKLCDWVRVSLDVPDREVFKKIKGVDAYEKVLKTIKRLDNVGIKFMLSKLWTDVEACEALAKDLGAYCQVKYIRNHDLALREAEAGEKCCLTPLRIVIDYDGTYYLCPFFHHQDLKIGKGKFQDIWGSKAHKEAIDKIDPQKCALYDCPFRDVDLKILEDAHLGWI